MQIIEVAPRLYRLDIPSALSDSDVEQYTNAMLQRIDEQRPFGCMFKYLGGPPKKSKHGHKIENEWLKRYKPKVGQYCKGIAIVSNPGIQVLIMKIVLSGAGEKFLGCKCNQFGSEAEALIWLNERLHERHVT
jgi:hypothetical protein